MSRFSRFMGDATTVSEPPPVVRLWALRALVHLNGQKTFVDSSGFSSDALAAYLGLGKWVDDDAFDRKTICCELRKLHGAAEADSACCQLPVPLVKNVQRLAALCSLSDVDCRILELVVLLHGERLLDNAMDTLGKVATRDLPLVFSVLLELPARAVKSALRDTGALLRSGLIKIDHDCGSIELQGKLDLVSDDFADRIYADEVTPIELFRTTVVSCPPAELSIGDYAHVAPSLAVLTPYLRHVLEAGKKGVNILLHGAPGTGKTQLSRVLAHELGCALFEVSSEDADEQPITAVQRLGAYRITQNFFGRQPTLIAFDEAEDVFSGDTRLDPAGTAKTRKAWVNRILESNVVPTLWISNSVSCLDPAFIRRFDMVLELPVPPGRQRERIIRASGAGLLDETMVRRMAKSADLAPAVVARAVSVVRPIRSQLGEGGEASAVELLVNATLEAQGHAVLPAKNDPNRLPDTYDPAFTSTDLDLAEIADGLMRSKAGRLCLYGPPGTGKTAYGRWLADYLDKPLLVRRASDLMSMWVGGTEKNIACAFKEAMRDDAVLLIDEIDSFLQDRRGASRSWEVTQVNEMLTQMEAFNGVFVASTNLMTNCDQAALRRFDLKARFGYLRREQAWALFVRYGEALGVSSVDDLVRRELGRLDKLTPGDFAAVARQDRFRPVPTAQAMVEALRAECELKEGASGRIGFL